MDRDSQSSNPDLVRKKDAALACVAPSLTYETVGLTLIEAFAYKTSVIVHDIGALPEMVRESGGIVYRTEHELVESLSRVASSPPFRNQFGERGYQAFLQRWSKESHLASYFALLAETARTKFGSVLGTRRHENPDTHLPLY